MDKPSKDKPLFFTVGRSRGMEVHIVNDLLLERVKNAAYLVPDTANINLQTTIVYFRYPRK